MVFYKIDSAGDVVDYVASVLSSRLSRGERVLWLLSGGSAIAVEVEVAKKLNSIDNLSNLSVSLIDERYGPLGHPDSNWQQLADSGFELPGAQIRPVLAGKDIQATAADYQTFLKDKLAASDFSFGLAGLGADGHTLGIKPGSPALETQNLIVAYDWEDYRRLTATARVIEKLDEIVVYALGREKLPQLKKLQKTLPAAEQPAQLLKLCPKLIIFNDQVGEKFLKLKQEIT